ncbi:MAG: hypothetical protein H7Y37_10210 [Anaerolineae bacterium]|nr:hypothetical protein [Gloeobacterales cyanobacterium ES-bin-313]
MRQNVSHLSPPFVQQSLQFYDPNSEDAALNIYLLLRIGTSYSNPGFSINLKGEKCMGMEEDLQNQTDYSNDSSISVAESLGDTAQEYYDTSSPEDWSDRAEAAQALENATDDPTYGNSGETFNEIADSKQEE